MCFLFNLSWSIGLTMQRMLLGSKFVCENKRQRSSSNYKFARRHLCRGKSIPRNQDLTKDTPCGCFLFNLSWSIGLTMQRMLLGSKFVCENKRQRSSSNYKFARRHLCRGKSIPRNQDLTKDTPCGCFLFNLSWSIGLTMQRMLLGSKFVCENKCKRSSSNYKFARRHLCRGKSIPRNQSFKTCPPGQVFICFTILSPSSKVIF